ncbi:hypothetical protein PGT21_030939 [Puccinia graminis f. sp. tritici]|uniref:Uncharacterized protein n=1 Tax=Puccinia graminis f. sp. tritici TaxID=56615 RepID=A0A5B0LXR6_PUCGR|nr:hypothetical protein PGT21_030939 [Puccinia graminis f. sp. tritici]
MMGSSKFIFLTNWPTAIHVNSPGLLNRPVYPLDNPPLENPSRLSTIQLSVIHPTIFLSTIFSLGSSSAAIDLSASLLDYLHHGSSSAAMGSSNISFVGLGPISLGLLSIPPMTSLYL